MTFMALGQISVVPGWIVLSRDIPLPRVEDEHERAIDHVPLVPRQPVHNLWDKGVRRDAERGQHGLLPEAGAAEDGGEGVDDAQRENALDGARDDAEGEGFCVVFVPGLDVEGEEGWGRVWSASVRSELGLCLCLCKDLHAKRVRTVFQP